MYDLLNTFQIYIYFIENTFQIHIYFIENTFQIHIYFIENTFQIHVYFIENTFLIYINFILMSKCLSDSTNWVIFQPNIIIDARLGCLWFLQINLDQTIELVTSIPLLIDFLMLRRNSKSVILKVCKNSIIGSAEENMRNRLGNMSLIFNKLNSAYKEAIAMDFNSNQTNCDSGKQKLRTIIDQTDIFQNVFSIFEEQKSVFNIKESKLLMILMIIIFLYFSRL